MSGSESINHTALLCDQWIKAAFIVSIWAAIGIIAVMIGPRRKEPKGAAELSSGNQR